MYVVSKSTFVGEISKTGVDPTTFINKTEPTEIVYRFKEVPPNERNIVPGREYWVSGYLCALESIALKHLWYTKINFTEMSLLVIDNSGVMIFYKAKEETNEEETNHSAPGKSD